MEDSNFDEYVFLVRVVVPNSDDFFGNKYSMFQKDYPDVMLKLKDPSIVSNMVSKANAGKPSVEALSGFCTENYEGSKESESNVFSSAIGGLITPIMKANGFRTSGKKKTVTEGYFKKGEVYVADTPLKVERLKVA